MRPTDSPVGSCIDWEAENEGIQPEAGRIYMADSERFMLPGEEPQLQLECSECGGLYWVVGEDVEKYGDIEHVDGDLWAFVCDPCAELLAMRAMLSLRTLHTVLLPEGM